MLGFCAQSNTQINNAEGTYRKSTFFTRSPAHYGGDESAKIDDVENKTKRSNRTPTKETNMTPSVALWLQRGCFDFGSHYGEITH